VAAEGLGVSVLGRVFAAVYNGNLSQAIPCLIAEINATEAKEKGVMVGTAIGAVVGLEALFAGPFSGASMNPARSLAPALVSGHLASLWVYLLSPALGAVLAVVVCRCVQRPGCCASVVEASTL